MGNGKLDINIGSKASILIFAMITLISTPIHEFGHLIGYQLSGIPAKFNFINTESINGSESLWGCLGGPAIGLLLALVGCIMVYIYLHLFYYNNVLYKINSIFANYTY